MITKKLNIFSSKTQANKKLVTFVSAKANSKNLTPIKFLVNHDNWLGKKIPYTFKYAASILYGWW